MEVLIKRDEYQFKRDFVILLVTYKSLIKVYKLFNYSNAVLGFKIMFISRNHFIKFFRYCFKIMFISRMMDFGGH